ncbi:MAG: hypothetical protein QXW29_04690 [Thermoplasmatales archaeon]
MNFYAAILISLSAFTVLFYINWNRIDRIVDERIFVRFLLYGILLGIVYTVLFLYAFITVSPYIDLIFLVTFVFLPLLSAGEQMSMFTGKYKNRSDLYQLGSSLGGAFSFPVSFGIAIITKNSIDDYFFVTLIAAFAFLTNMMSGMLLSKGAMLNKIRFYYFLAFLVQMMFSSAVFLELLEGSYSLIAVIPEVLVAVALYLRFFHRELGTIRSPS